MRSVTATTTVCGKFANTDEVLEEFWRSMRAAPGGRKQPPQEYIEILDISKDKGGYFIHYKADLPEDGKLGMDEAKLLAAKPTETPKPAPIVTAPAPADAETMQLNLKDIIITGSNYRKTFNEEKLQQLAASMNAVGQINAITVRPKGEKRYELIAGERRVRAARLNKWTIIRAYVVIADDDKVLEIMAAENFGREDLDPIEAANAVARAMKITGATQTKVAEAFGKSQPWVAQMLKLVEAPAVLQDAIISQLITVTHVIELLAHKDAPYFEDAVDRLIEAAKEGDPLNVKDLRYYLADYKAAVTCPAPTVAPEPEPEYIPKPLSPQADRKEAEAYDRMVNAGAQAVIEGSKAMLPSEPEPSFIEDIPNDDGPAPTKAKAAEPAIKPSVGPASYEAELTWNEMDYPVLDRQGNETLLEDVICEALKLDTGTDYKLVVYYQPGGYIKIVRSVN